MKDRARGAGAADADIVEALYAAVAEPRGWQGAVAAVAESFHAAGAAFVYLDGAAPIANLTTGVGVWNDDVIARYHEFAPFDPAPPAFAREPRGTATTTDRMVMSAEAKKSIFYNEFFRPLGLVECAGGVVFGEGHKFSLIGIHRGKERRAFTDAELRRLEGLLPHLRRAFQLRNAFLRANIEAQALSAAVDRLPMGIALIVACDGALHVNAALRGMAAIGNGLKLDAKGWVRAEARDADRRLVALQTGVLEDAAPGGIAAIPRADGGRPYLALVAPLPQGMGFGGAAGDPLARGLVLVHDPAAAIPELPERLMQMFGLTAAAARLAAALAAGVDLERYAEREGITLHTARFHLKSAFARLDVRSQSALVRAVVRALAELALSRG